MKIESYNYLIEKEDLSILDKIFNLRDNREEFFIPDYKRDQEYKEYNCRACNVEYVKPVYYVENVSKILKDKYGIFNFKLNLVCSPSIEFKAEKIFNLNEVNDIKDILTNEANKFLSIQYIDFDLREYSVYKEAIILNRLSLFEEWLYGNYLCQLNHICYDKDNFYQVDKVSEGIYRYPFIECIVREKSVKKQLKEWLEETGQHSLSNTLRNGR